MIRCALALSRTQQSPRHPPSAGVRQYGCKAVSAAGSSLAGGYSRRDVAVGKHCKGIRLNAPAVGRRGRERL